jgi:sialate O-acetylesterase
MHLLFILLLGLSNFAAAQVSQKWLDINYAGDTLNGHLLDIYLPKEGKAPYPVIITIAGSAFFSDKSKDRAFKLGEPLLDQGFAIVATNHRSSRKSIFPAHANDIKGVVRFVRANASKYQLDTDFIGIAGNSSGGHLSAFTALSAGIKEYTVGKHTLNLEGDIGGNLSESSHVDAVVDWYGPTDFQAMDECGSKMTHDAPDSPESVLVGGPIQENEALCKIANPITYIDSQDPPFLIIHGTADSLVPYCQSVLLQEALDKAGVSNELITVPGAGHGGPWEADYMDDMISFFVKAKNQKKKKLKLNPLLSDHMVLQQQSDAAIWGVAVANSTIMIEASWGKKVEAKASANGKWSAQIPTPEAGGPYQITLSSDHEKITLEDVLIGEVWLCSGQSNMEMPMNGFPPNELIANSQADIQAANFPKIRMFTVRKNFSVTPKKELDGAWAVCSPETAGAFSATAFYFGRKVHQELDIPIGLIHSSWGGTPAEAWTSQDFLETMPEYKEIGTQIKTLGQEQEKLNQWLDEKKQVKVDSKLGEEQFKVLDLGSTDPANIDYDDSKWQNMQLPKLWEYDKLAEFNGAVWYRKTIDIPEAWQDKTILLELSAIDDMDRTYVNGQKVGGIEVSGFWQEKRSYEFSGKILQAGKNTIAVLVLDTGGGGGFHGEATDMRIYPKENKEQAIDISGKWLYSPAAEYNGNTFYIYDQLNLDYTQRPKMSMPYSSHTPTGLYNGMIAPLVPYTLKGAIWYQGESNVGRAEQYERLFPLMIKSWRDKWKTDFPFYFTQIAPYPYSGNGNRESAELRFAQHKTLTLANTGEAVTLDIGDLESIHPSNKKDVGERLALWALAKDYSKSIPYSGPVCTAAKAKGKEIILSFEIGAETLAAGPEGLQEFELVFSDGSVKEVAASIDGSHIILKNDSNRNPKAVQYAWKNGSKAALFNSAGLPASTFYVEIK